MRRKRRSTQTGEFEDPLKDYSPRDYDDDMERALSEDSLTKLQTKPLLTLDAGTTLQQVLGTMAETNVACVMVTENDRLVGIFSERDVLYKVSDRYAQVKDKPIREVMTPNPVIAYETDTPAKALNFMAVGGFRHVPVLNVDDKVVGMLGPRRVTAYLYQHYETDTSTPS